MRYLSLTLFLLLAPGVQSQTTWSEKIEPVQASGYHNIMISPELIGQTDHWQLNTWRIFDEQGKEVPYFVRPSSSSTLTHKKAFPLLTHTAKDSVNTLVIENDEERTLDHLYLDMKRADVRKSIRIRGANELHEWYMVKEHTPQQDDREEAYRVDFPQGNYRYYEITIRNSGGSPLHISGAYRFEIKHTYDEMIPLPLHEYTISTNSLTQNTTITFHNTQPYRVTQLTFYISEPALYLRAATVVDHFGVKTIQWLSSREDNQLHFHNLLVDSTLKITIDNNKNPSLLIDSIRAQTPVTYLCASLEKGKNYTIQLNYFSEARYYDIQHFKDEIGEDLPIVKTSGLESHTVEPPAIVIRFYERAGFLWGVMILVGLILVIICLRSLRELKQK